MLLITIFLTVNTYEWREIKLSQEHKHQSTMLLSFKGFVSSDNKEPEDFALIKCNTVDSRAPSPQHTRIYGTHPCVQLRWQGSQCPSLSAYLKMMTPFSPITPFGHADTQRGPSLKLEHAAHSWSPCKRGRGRGKRTIKHLISFNIDFLYFIFRRVSEKEKY